MFFPIVNVLVILIGMPAYFIISVWRARGDPRAKWLLHVVTSGVLIGWIFLIGPWDWLSYYLRYGMLLAYGAVVLLSMVPKAAGKSSGSVSNRLSAQSTDSPTGVPDREKSMISAASKSVPFHWAELVPLIVFIALFGWSMTGLFPSGHGIDLDFPLKDGWFYVRQGGRSTLLNYHVAYPPQRYALDITALNAWGARARGLYPTEPEKYVIFGKTVYSPCSGTILRVVDGLPDLPPPQSDSQNVAGNHVIMDCDGIELHLAHFKEGSIVVTAGESVEVGRPLGQVGNSGNTSEPHLHIHAVKAMSSEVDAGEAVPIRFRGTFFVRNGTWR